MKEIVFYHPSRFATYQDIIRLHTTYILTFKKNGNCIYLHPENIGNNIMTIDGLKIIRDKNLSKTIIKIN